MVDTMTSYFAKKLKFEFIILSSLGIIIKILV